MEWIFDGIGTAIITLIIGFIGGGTVGYRIAIKKTKTVQKQKAGDNAQQTQIGGNSNVG